ncbi:MAG: fluoride efflux transporter CrcB [Bacillota bacterium]|nr:fluoride efflux transporter CrcB [Bacillota bacterium]
MDFIFVGLGGFIGSVSRYLIGSGMSAAAVNFPLPTLLINFTGAVLIGAVTEYSAKIPINANLLRFLTVGICGGFTTFSTFSLETVNLFEKGKPLLGFSYAALSFFLCFLGIVIGKSISRFVAG